MAVLSKSRLKVADEVWIATALLHREQPQQPDFTVEEILKRVEREGLAGVAPAWRLRPHRTALRR